MPFKSKERKAQWMKEHRRRPPQENERPTLDRLKLRRDFYLSDVYVMPQYSERPDVVSARDPKLNPKRELKRRVQLGCTAFTKYARPCQNNERPCDNPNFVSEWIAARQVEAGVPIEEACLDSVNSVELIEKIFDR